MYRHFFRSIAVIGATICWLFTPTGPAFACDMAAQGGEYASPDQTAPGLATSRSNPERSVTTGPSVMAREATIGDARGNSIVLDPSLGYFVVVNTIVVKPGKAEQALDLLRKTAQAMRGMHGLVSVSLHVSSDESRVLTYIQWRSKSDFEAMRQSTAVQPFRKALRDLSESQDLVTYSLRVSCERERC